MSSNALASAVLSPPKSSMDETLTSYLAAPLPEEVLRKTANPANLFGKYVFLHEIGRGATGTVVKAWDTYLSRHVALKFLHATASRNIELDDSQRVQDFLREARLAARLRHPHIVQIHEVDCREGRYFISMDFIGGGTLAERIHGSSDIRAASRFYHEPGRFLDLLHTIALAVHHAHRQNPPVVHRDLKPQNVLLDAQDKPFVADFGLANEVQAGPVAGAGGVRGTPAYMAPEQALGRTEEIDPRTDVYSLGVILFEMLTGEAPFKGENIPSVLRKVATQDPDVPSAVAERALPTSPERLACAEELRRSLDRICLKALSKKREHRYESALHFAEALNPFRTRAADSPAAPPSAPAPRIRRRHLALAAVPIAILLGLLLIPFFRPAPAVPAATPAPRVGDDLALLATQCQSAGEWPAMRGIVAELRKKAPQHPKLAGLESALSVHDADLQRHRQDWAAILEKLRWGGQVPKDLGARLRAVPELRTGMQGDLRLVLAQRESTLLEEATALVSGGPSPAWVAADFKSRVSELRARVEDLRGVAKDLHDGFDDRPLAAASSRLDAAFAYRGTWSLRINLTPFAEFRIVNDQTELAHDLTPSRFAGLEVRPDRSVLEIAWPSFREPRRRWSGPLPSLSSGDTLVVSGELDNPDVRVEHP
jgi:serine/threonine protein kinase